MNCPLARALLMLTLLAAGVSPVRATPLRSPYQNPGTPDNSAENAHPSTTADQQPNAAADRRTTAQIRRAILADKSLSIYGHNCKIIVAGGKVTLKGPVKSEDERQRIVADAATVVNSDSISDQLTVQ
jgi:osmotically-inducible protein OsmY